LAGRRVFPVSILIGFSILAMPSPKAQDASSCDAGTKIIPAVGEYGDGYGSSVSLDGNTGVIGAPGGNAIYVLAHDSGTWSLQEKITSGPGWFGTSVSVSGDTIAVGAPQENGGLYHSGAVYIFERMGGLWTEQAKIPFDDMDVSRFGESVALDGDRLAIGAPGADHGTAQGAGAIYIYARSGDTWTQEAILTAHDPSFLEYMGSSVSLSGDTVVAGAIRDADHGYESGAAYVFIRNGGSWTEQAKLASEGTSAEDRFGWSVSISGDMLAIGSPFGGSSHYGSVALFHRSDGVWTEESTLSASDPTTSGRFGSSVSFDGDLLAVGSMWGAYYAGEGYLFSFCGGRWREQTRLLANDGSNDGWLGSAIALSGDTLLAGAPHDSPHGFASGSTYAFTGCTPECLLPCPRSKDYWKSHPSEWPLVQFPFDNHNYSQAELLELLSIPPKGDASVILMSQLTVTFLNLVVGSDPVPVLQPFLDAYALLSGYPGRLPYGVRPSTVEGRAMIALSDTLEHYNKGFLTPDCVQPPGRPDSFDACRASSSTGSYASQTSERGRGPLRGSGRNCRR
jgi:hypothetical protein